MKLEFEQIWPLIQADNLLAERKSRLVYRLLTQGPIEGAMAEVGVYQGRTSKLMRLAAPERKLYLYDTFEGIKGANPDHDIHIDGEFAVPLEAVRNFVGTDNTEYRMGFFPESFTEHNQKFAFVHSDTDTYHGAQSTLETFWPLMVPDGIILMDDYKWWKCPGIKEAIIEFMAKTNNVIFTPGDNQAFLRKI